MSNAIDTPSIQLILVERGVLAVHLDEVVWVAGMGRAAWVPAGVFHAVRSIGNTIVHTVKFDADSADRHLEGSATVVAVESLLYEIVLALTDADNTQLERDHLRAVALDRLHSAEQVGIVLPVAHDARLAQVCARGLCRI